MRIMHGWESGRRVVGESMDKNPISTGIRMKTHSVDWEAGRAAVDFSGWGKRAGRSAVRDCRPRPDLAMAAQLMGEN